MINELCTVGAFLVECYGERVNLRHEYFIHKGSHVGITQNGDISSGCYVKGHKGVLDVVSSKKYEDFERIPGWFIREGNGDIKTRYKEIAEPGAKYKILAGIIESIPSSIDLINSIYKAVESREKNSLPVSQISQEQHSLDYYANLAEIINNYPQNSQVNDILHESNKQKMRLCA